MVDHPATVPPLGDVSDLDAIAAITHGNREMFEVIVRRYNQPLYRVGMAYLRNHAQVEDAMQNTYVKAFLNLPRFERTAAFSTWITRIMINECLMVLRHQRSRPETALDEHQLEQESTAASVLPFHPSFDTESDHAAADQLSRAEMKRLLEEAVSTLPRKYRTVYIMREVQQLSTAEVAAALGVSEGSVKVDLHRARERLKVELLKSAAGAELFAYPACFCDPMVARVMKIVRTL
jgi:RNA polymerase sigma-70 factor (ECF subfamily)